MDPHSTRVVLEALEDPRYGWRTVDGVARQTGLTRKEVLAVMDASADRVLRSRSTTPDGAPLYTTREHYQRRAGVGARLLAALRNRVRP
jgi:hypothetical protein